MISSLSLRLYNPVIATVSASRFVEDLSRKARGWSRSIRKNGGYWQGDFSLLGDLSYLSDFFYNRLGYHFEEKYAGQKTWEGLIYEMDLVVNGVRRRRSLNNLSNYVTAMYTDEKDVTRTSAAASLASSISRYGRREELLLMSGYPQTAAEARRDLALKENQWPAARMVGVERSATTFLEVSVCGYVFTGNWRFETAGDGTTGNLSTYLGELITTDCEFLSAGGIDTNTLQVRKDTSSPRRVWDVMQELNEMGLSGAPTRIYVDNDRRLYYRTMDSTPRYFLRGDKLYDTLGGKSESIRWLVKPAVVRDATYPISKAEYSGWLADARDFVMTEVEAGEAGLTWKTEDLEESDILAATQKYAKMLADEAEAASGPKEKKGKQKTKSKIRPGSGGGSGGSGGGEDGITWNKPPKPIGGGGGKDLPT